MNGGIPQGCELVPIAFDIQINNFDHGCTRMYEIIMHVCHTSGMEIGNIQARVNKV